MYPLDHLAGHLRMECTDWSFCVLPVMTRSTPAIMWGSLMNLSLWLVILAMEMCTTAILLTPFSKPEWRITALLQLGSWPVRNSLLPDWSGMEILHSDLGKRTKRVVGNAYISTAKATNQRYGFVKLSCIMVIVMTGRKTEGPVSVFILRQSMKWFNGRIHKQQSLCTTCFILFT